MVDCLCWETTYSACLKEEGNTGTISDSLRDLRPLCELSPQGLTTINQMTAHRLHLEDLSGMAKRVV